MADISLSHGYACVRSLDGNGLPTMPGAPGAWIPKFEHNGWVSILSADGETLLAAWRANAIGAEALYALFGPKSVLNNFAASDPRCMPAAELWSLAQGGNATAISVVRRWPTWRFSGFERDRDGNAQTVTSGYRRLIYEGQSMPAPGTAFPWRFAADGTIVGTDAAAKYRVNGPIASIRPAFSYTLGGYALNTVLEDEPEV